MINGNVSGNFDGNVDELREELCSGMFWVKPEGAYFSSEEINKIINMK